MSTDNDDRDTNDDGGDDTKPQGLSTNEMLWILLAIAAVLLISRGIQHLF
ncbi:hypothetical protein [Haloechinothrix halophila]|nr:hypothetical protein [Haloechinothrix halophila]